VKKILYIIYIPLLLLEWFVDLIHKMVAAIHESVKDITLSIEKYINEPIKPKPGDKG